MNAMMLLLAITLFSGFAFFGSIDRVAPVSDEPSNVAQTDKQSPFACDVMALSPKERKRHFEELGPKLRSLKKSVRELADGYEFEFSADQPTLQLLAEWSAREHLCCPFFDIDLRIECEGGPVWLRLTGRQGTKEFIRSDFARWFA